MLGRYWWIKPKLPLEDVLIWGTTCKGPHTIHPFIRSTNTWLYVKPIMCQALSSMGNSEVIKTRSPCSHEPYIKLGHYVLLRVAYIPVRAFLPSPVGGGNQVMGRKQAHVSALGTCCVFFPPSGSMGWMETQHGKNINLGWRDASSNLGSNCLLVSTTFSGAQSLHS